MEFPVILDFKLIRMKSIWKIIDFFESIPFFALRLPTFCWYNSRHKMSRMDISTKLWKKSDKKSMIILSVIFGHANKHLSDKK